MTPAPDALAAARDLCRCVEAFDTAHVFLGYARADDAAGWPSRVPQYQADHERTFSNLQAAIAAFQLATNTPSPEAELRRATENARVLRAALEHARYIRGGFERFIEDTGPWGHALARIDGYQTVVDGLVAIDAALAQLKAES